MTNVTDARKIVTTTAKQLYLSEESPILINRIFESFKLGLHQHEFVELNYVSEGRGFQYVEDRVIEVTKGDFFLLPVGVSHVFRPATSSPERSRLVVYNCLFDDLYVQKLLLIVGADEGMRKLLQLPFPEQGWYHMKDKEFMLERSFSVMHEEFIQRKIGYDAVIQIEVIRLLVHLRRSLIPDADAGMLAIDIASNGKSGFTDNREDRFVNDAIDDAASTIRMNPGQAPRMMDLANLAGLSERQFRRRFKERMGATYMDYVHKCRIEMCCTLLLKSAYSISGVARQVGYRDLKFFNRLFKAKTGMTPSEYRKTGHP